MEDIRVDMTRTSRRIVWLVRAVSSNARSPLAPVRLSFFVGTILYLIIFLGFPDVALCITIYNSFPIIILFYI
jgi:hypothetical protein